MRLYNQILWQNGNNNLSLVIFRARCSAESLELVTCNSGRETPVLTPREDERRRDGSTESQFSRRLGRANSEGDSEGNIT